MNRTTDNTTNAIDWRCRIGVHDWQTVRSLAKRYLNLYARDNSVFLLDKGMRPFFRERICLRCCKHEDQITAAVQQVLLDDAKQMARRELARRIKCALTAERGSRKA